jgi:N-acetylglucosaminyl-diphospho-decaprenol L-rhamnosyltransferase
MIYTTIATTPIQNDGVPRETSPSRTLRVRYSIAIILLNYRTPELAVDCLASLAGQVEPDMQVVVVDNASGDGSADRIEQFVKESGYGDWIKVVRSPVNGGFAAGNNIGIRAVDADAYILLNSDTIVRQGAIAALREAMRQRPDAGIIGPRLEDRDGTPQVSAFRSPTPTTELLRSARTGVLTRFFKRHDVVMPVTDEPMEADWIAFACVLIRREVVDKIGLLDDGYFMYFEDVDYCNRAREAGFKVLYCPVPKVAHIAGASSNVVGSSNPNRRPPRYWYEARSRYFAKFHGRAGVLRANAMFAVGRAVSLGREVLGRAPHLSPREERDIWTNWSTPFKPSQMRPADPNGQPAGDTNDNPSDIGFIGLLAEDYRTFENNPLEPGFWAIALHRFGNWRMGVGTKVVRAPLTVLYRVGHTAINWAWGIDLPYTVKLGRRVRIWHHGGMVLVARSIGNDVVLRHNTTLGIARLAENAKRPTIEDRVEIGCGACILGDITIGHDSVVGANAVVLHTFPPNSTIAGVPARAVGNSVHPRAVSDDRPHGDTPKSGFF